MNRRGKLFQGILTFQMLIMMTFILSIFYDTQMVSLICLVAWGISTTVAQESYDNLIGRIEDLEKKKEDDENGN